MIRANFPTRRVGDETPGVSSKWSFVKKVGNWLWDR